MEEYWFWWGKILGRLAFYIWVALTLQSFAVMVYLSEQIISSPKLSRPKHIPACKVCVFGTSVQRSTAGNDVVATIFISLFLPRRDLFS